MLAHTRNTTLRDTLKLSIACGSPERLPGRARLCLESRPENDSVQKDTRARVNNSFHRARAANGSLDAFARWCCDGDGGRKLEIESQGVTSS